MASTRRAKAVENREKIRSSLWPDLAEEKLWSRHDKVGFETIPRAMPLLLLIMDDMSNGSPVSKLYLDLWCHTWDDAFVIITKPREHAFAAGFGGQRAEGTWASRMRLLEEMGFIQTKSGPSGTFNYVLILNPYLVVKEQFEKKHPGIRQEAWNALHQRVIEIGAKDFEKASEEKPKLLVKKKIGFKKVAKKIPG